ncbi:hypothetical protein MKZ38_003951 [Zalerion maritima]|uniref:Ankyrin n=1 Tax=Zalerion maritima TaxID=339359 RepID=A0AAD5WRF3_9PEZI|nr:hypothetical protein MKZ38_003951 [Zalerion maritima]
MAPLPAFRSTTMSFNDTVQNMALRASIEILKRKESGGMVVGIVVGILVGSLMLTLLIAWFCHRASRKQIPNQQYFKMIDPSLRIRRAIHSGDASLVARILRTHPSLLHNPDITPSYSPSFPSFSSPFSPYSAPYSPSPYQAPASASPAINTPSTSGLSNSNLHLAASLGHLPIVQLLHKLGHESPSPALNASHQTSLHLAAAAGHTEVVHFLASCSPASILRPDVRGRDSIMEACSGGHDTIVQLLLTYVPGGPEEALRRCDLEGNTALHFASGHANLLVVRTLLAAGSDPERKNAWSWTPGAYSATVQAEVYLKNLVGEVERRRAMLREIETRGAKGAGVRVVREDE